MTDPREHAATAEALLGAAGIAVAGAVHVAENVDGTDGDAVDVLLDAARTRALLAVAGELHEIRRAMRRSR
jgi:pheromone shutdown protein TraB